MRGLMAVGVAAVILIGAVLYLQSTDLPTDVPAAPIARPQAPKAQERSARVEERLSELRDDMDQRHHAAPGNVAPVRREVPTMAARQMEAPVDHGVYEEDQEDPQEMEELKVTLLSDPDPDERVGAVLMLTGEEGPESLRMLLEAMDDPDPEVRLAVVEALGDRAEELSPSTLAGALRDPDAEVRFEAVSILGDMDSPEAMDMVRSAMNDEDEDVRALAEGIDDLDDEDDDEMDLDDDAIGSPAPRPTQHG